MIQLKRKVRHQCRECFKTFYTPDKRERFTYAGAIEYKCCPHCGGNYIKV